VFFVRSENGPGVSMQRAENPRFVGGGLCKLTGHRALKFGLCGGVVEFAGVVRKRKRTTSTKARSVSRREFGP
jgi:hypothetical protein